MPIRLSGLASGLDTEAIVGALVSAYSFKKDKYVKAQTKLSWKQDAWKTLNSKVYGFYTNVGSMRLSSNYQVKKTTVSDTTKAKATATGSAITGTQTLEIKQLAKTAYITGAKLNGSITGSTTLGTLGIKSTSAMEKASISIRTGTKATNIELESDMTVNQFVNKLAEAGVDANFDEKNQRFYISSKTSGAAGDFTISANSAQGLNALKNMGLLSDSEVSNINNATGGSLAKKLFSTGEGGYDYLLDSVEMKQLLTDLKNYKQGTATFDDEKVAQLTDLETYLNKYADKEYTVTTKGEDGKDHYLVCTVAILMDTTHEDYETYGADIDSRQSLILNALSETIGQYTYEDVQALGQAGVQDACLEKLQEVFGTAFIYQVALSGYIVQ